MKLLTRQCAGEGCRSTAAVRLALLAGENQPRERSCRGREVPRAPAPCREPSTQRLSDSSESKPTQTALGSVCKRGEGAGPAAFSPPPHRRSAIFLSLRISSSCLSLHGRPRCEPQAKPSTRGRPEASSTRQNRERSARCVFLWRPGSRGCPTPEPGGSGLGAHSGRSPAAPPQGVEEEEKEEEWGVSAVLPRPAG